MLSGFWTMRGRKAWSVPWRDTERFNYRSIGTPNEVNVYAFDRFVQDPKVSPEAVWNEWAIVRDGEKAAPEVIRALKLTYDITNLTLYPQQQYWVTNAPGPEWGLWLEMIKLYSVADWVSSPFYDRAKSNRISPDESMLISMAADKKSRGR